MPHLGPAVEAHEVWVQESHRQATDKWLDGLTTKELERAIETGRSGHMNVKIHEVNGTQIAEMLSAGIIIRTSRDAADIVEQMLSLGLKKLVLHERNVAPEFWQLETGIAGEVLQKLTNYRIRVMLVGDFGSYKSKSLQAFIAESNQGREVGFAENLETALERMGAE